MDAKFNMNHWATSKIWIGPCTWTLKNLDPEKSGINIGLKNVSDFRDLCFTKTIRKVSYCLKARALTGI